MKEEIKDDALTYTLEQFPKNKDIDPVKLSNEQASLRKCAKKYTYGKEVQCKKCARMQPVGEYWLKNKETGRRDRTCRDCRLKAAGVIEVGKSRFSMKLFDKGFRRCTTCKTIKPMEEYSRLRGAFGGINNTCKDCSFRLHKDFQRKQQAEVTDWYLRSRAKERGIDNPAESDLEIIRIEVQEERKPKHFLDGRGFVSIAEFARYIKEVYGNPVSMTEKRIGEGKSLADCRLSEREIRSRAHTEGAIRVTDTVTGKVFMFRNTRDPDLLKMFGNTTVTSCIRSGKPTRVFKLTKYKNPCTIARICNPNDGNEPILRPSTTPTT